MRAAATAAAVETLNANDGSIEIGKLPATSNALPG